MVSLAFAVQVGGVAVAGSRTIGRQNRAIGIVLLSEALGQAVAAVGGAVAAVLVVLLAGVQWEFTPQMQVFEYTGARCGRAVVQTVARGAVVHLEGRGDKGAVVQPLVKKCLEAATPKVCLMVSSWWGNTLLAVVREVATVVPVGMGATVVQVSEDIVSGLLRFVTAL